MNVHRVRGVVAFHETDASGRYHYTNALKWVENVEHALYRSVGVRAATFPRRAVAASFERSFVDGDEYEVELEVEKVGNTSITYVWRILKGEHVAVNGSHTVVHIDGSGRPTPLPDALRAVLDGLANDTA
ncbi:thioesterase family protein [Thermopolyspora sp. NPDC052614]|uniref:acyl-CoA thioesterase n=1 Tax=Thermopolyspora sp. NPDC052614 TaxID=3155682 RepID=UPI00344530B4